MPLKHKIWMRSENLLSDTIENQSITGTVIQQDMFEKHVCSLPAANFYPKIDRGYLLIMTSHKIIVSLNVVCGNFMTKLSQIVLDNTHVYTCTRNVCPIGCQVIGQKPF
jgi:hypothetical protein